jgi:hypothetical protein
MSCHHNPLSWEHAPAPWMMCVPATPIFYVHLAMLGKTNLTALERVLFETNSTTSTKVPRSRKNQLHLPNPVFVYDVSQLDGSNVDVSESVRRNLQDYLGLHSPCPCSNRLGQVPVRQVVHNKDQHKTRWTFVCPSTNHCTSNSCRLPGKLRNG